MNAALELLAGFGVVLAHLLNGRRTDLYAIALAESVGQFLQVETGEPLMAFTNGAMAGFVAVVPHQIDLACHRKQRSGVLVLDAQLEGLGVFHTVYYSLVIEIISRGKHGAAT